MENKFVDVHCHILNEVDDGSYSLENSIEMASLAAEGGTGDIICTPHCIKGHFDNYRSEAVEEKFTRLKEAVKENNIPVNFHLGMEVYGTVDTVEDLKNNRLYSMAESRYILVEFNFGEKEDLVNYILDGIGGNGYIPVMAHPERYHFVAHNPMLLFDWTDKGYLLQCNKDSIRKKFGPTPYCISRDILKDNLYSFIGSDAHGATHRTPYLEYAYNDVCELCGKEYADKIFITNGRKLIENDIVTI